MSQPQAISDQDFDRSVLQAKEPVLVDFWAPWCGPCRQVGPVVESLAQEYAGKVKVAKLNVDENPQTPAKYSVMSIPTLILFQGGQVVTQMVGARSKEEFKKVLDEALKGAK